MSSEAQVGQEAADDRLYDLLSEVSGMRIPWLTTPGPASSWTQGRNSSAAVWPAAPASSPVQEAAQPGLPSTSS